MMIVACLLTFSSFIIVFVFHFIIGIESFDDILFYLIYFYNKLMCDKNKNKQKP